MSAVIVDSAVHVECFRQKTHCTGWKEICGSIFGRSVSSVLAAGHNRLMGRLFLPILSSLSGFRIGMIIALCHISGNCPVEIDDVSEIVDGTMSELLEVETAHPV